MVRPPAVSDGSVTLHLTVPAGVRPATLRAWARAARRRLPGRTGQLIIATLDARRMTQLNRRYRRRAEPTNVLSFLYSSPSYLPAPERVWGEVVLCPTIIVAEAKRFGRTSRQHLRALLEHGCLHLLGLDHRTPLEQRRWRRYEHRLRQ